MSVPLTWSSLRPSEQQQLTRDHQLRLPPTTYCPKPVSFPLYSLDVDQDTVYVPMGSWPKYFTKFPTTINDYPQSLGNLPRCKSLYTRDSDPTGQGRDQVTVVTEATRQLQTQHSTFISASPGYGKCFGKGTLIMTYNQGLLPVEKIRPGDYLISDQEKLTQVLSTTHGVELLYRVTISQCESFVCNASHILTLVKVPTPESLSVDREWFPHELVDMSLMDYLRLPAREQACYKSVFRRNTELPMITRESMARITSDWILTNTILDELKQHGASPWLAWLRFMDSDLREIVFWSLMFRLATQYGPRYYFSHPNDDVVTQFLLTARSLGYLAMYSISRHHLVVRSCKREYHYVQAPKIEVLNQGAYYGFALHPHHRFLLASYTVVHNTLMGVHMALEQKLPTAIICHIDIVRNQWITAIREMTADQARIHVVQGKKRLDPKAHFYMMGVEKGSKLHPDDLEHIGTVIVDEAHICTLKAFTETLLRFQPLYLIGLSATPDRADGLHAMFRFYFDPTSFIVRTLDKTWHVHKVKTSFKPYVEYMMVKGKSVRNWSLMMSSLEENPQRWALIAKIVADYPKEKILILSHRTAQTRGVYNLIRKTESATLLVGSEKHYDRTARVTCCGMKKGGVGMDDSTLTMIILASDAKDVRQFIGRLRGRSGTIVDLVDDDYALENHWRLRRAYYQSQDTIIDGDEPPKRYPLDDALQPFVSYLND